MSDVSTEAWHRELFLNSEVMTGKVGSKWRPTRTEYSGDHSHGSIFHDRYEPHFEEYVTKGLDLDHSATDEDISAAMEIQGKLTGVISAHSDQWGALVLMREMQKAENQAIRDASATL